MIKTVNQFLLNHLIEHPDHKDLVMIMNDLVSIGKFISHKTNKAGLVDMLGATNKTNVHSEEVQKLDVFANEKCKEFLRETGLFAAMASEEEESVVDMGQSGTEAKYVVAFDPLDGSSNIDVNVSIGTIFSVHRRLSQFERTDERQFLQKGRDQVLAGYILYGSSTVLVFSFGEGVYEFTLDGDLGEFLLSREKIVLPKSWGIYSVNEGNMANFSDKDRSFIETIKKDDKSARYIGSLVADFHRNLIKGGVFLYPAVDKNHSGEFAGKLRLNYEAKPMAFLIEQAGGRATNGSVDILDIQPTFLHERTALVIGNADAVERYLNF